MNINKKKVAFHTLGCKLNFAETSTISRSFPEDRFEKVTAREKADIYVINTCSVTDTADRKCRQAIKKFIHQSPDAFIIVAGCYAQLKPQEISAIRGVDLVLGINEKFDIASYIDNPGKRAKPEIHSCDLSSTDRFNASFSAGDRTRSFLKVQDGCDYVCAYCTIPMARGASRNPDISTLIYEAETIAGRRIKEIVLTGVNIGDFGKSTGDSFYDLLLGFVKVDGIERYRISSIEPNLLTDDIIKLASSNRKILPHFHIPLQSGSNKILGLMRRRYNREVFSDRIKVIKDFIPGAGIGADVIVGFPGESAGDFGETYDFLEGLPLSYLHVFTFSERPGTVAFSLPGKVSFEEKESRSKKLLSLSKQKHYAFLTQNLGNEESVLFEHTKSAGMISGYTGNYIRVEHPWQSALAGEVKKVRLTDIAHNDRMNIELID
jgi:threonylcarbamoyladenosine tRNA methylthiotransferase MtaB